MNYMLPLAIGILIYTTEATLTANEPSASPRNTTPAASPNTSKPYTAEIATPGLLGTNPLHQQDWACAMNNTTFLHSDEFGRFCTEAAEEHLQRHDPATAAIRRKNRAAHLEYTPRGHLFFRMDNSFEWYLASTCTQPGMGGDIGACGTCQYTVEQGRIVLEFTVKTVTSTLRLPIDNTSTPSGNGRLCIDLSDPVFGKDIYPEIPVVIEKHTPAGTIIQKTPFGRFGIDDTYNHNVIAASWNSDETAVLITQHWKWHSEIYLYAETKNHRYLRSGNLSETCATALERRIRTTLPDLARQRSKIARQHPYTLQGTMRCDGNHQIIWQMNSYPPKSLNSYGDFQTNGSFHYAVKNGKLHIKTGISTLTPEPNPVNEEEDRENQSDN